VAQDTEVQDWAKALVKRVGQAVKAARQGKSAAWLSDRTDELGYRISPTVIAKLDSGHRGEVLSVPELLILAAALDIPPALLLFPSFPSGTVELLPDDRQATGYEAVKWVGGERTLPARRVDRDRGVHQGPVNVGTQLVAAVRERDRLNREHLYANMQAAQPNTDKQAARLQIDDLDEQLATVNARIADLYEQLGVAAASSGESSDG
jgi:hypothetical protein